MRITNTVLIMLVFFIGTIITSCQKQINTAPPVIPNDNISTLYTLQVSVSALKKRCDSLSASLTQENATAVTLNANILNLATIPGGKKINVDSIKTLIGVVLSQSATLGTQVTGISAQIASLNTQLNTSSNIATLTTIVEQSDAQLNKINQQYSPLSAQLGLAESETETAIRVALGSKSYIALASAQNVANYAGDVIACPGYYLSVYTHFYRNSTDTAATFIAARKSTDTTGVLWGNEITVSPNIGKLNVSSVSLYRVDPNTVNCYFLVKNSTADTRLYLATSPDNGTTWSPPVSIIHEGLYDIFMNSSIHAVNNGRIVIPIASDPVFAAGFIFSDYCFYSDNGGSSWTKSSSFTPPITGGGLEPKIIQLSGDTCLMNLRTSTGFQYFSISTDNCKTWGEPYKSTLESPSSPAEIVNISGKLLAIHNNSAMSRNPLSISVSADKGATWRHVKDIETGSAAIYGWSYPSVTVSNGYLLLSYYETVNMPKPISLQYYHLKFNKIQISTLAL